MIFLLLHSEPSNQTYPAEHSVVLIWRTRNQHLSNTSDRSDVLVALTVEFCMDQLCAYFGARAQVPRTNAVHEKIFFRWGPKTFKYHAKMFHFKSI